MDGLRLRRPAGAGGAAAVEGGGLLPGLVERRLGGQHDRLGALAPKVVVPRAPGAFYCLLRLASREHPLALAERLIREHRVAVIPGSAFGVEDQCLLRVSYGALRAETVLDAQAPVVLSGPIAAFPLDGPGPGGRTALAATLRLQAD